MLKSHIRLGGILVRHASRRLARPTAPLATIARPAGRRALAVLLLAAACCTGARGAENPYRASISKAARQDAIESIPFDRLPAAKQQLANDVLDNVSVFRRLPIGVIQCDPELYLYVVDHPEIIANVWQLLGIENVVLRPIGPDRFRAEDGAGTVGTVEFLYRSHDTHVIFADGAYDGPMFTKPVRGKCLLVLKTGYLRESSGEYYITNRLDAFIHLDHAGVEFLAKTFQPLVGRVADYNFLATGSFLESLSRTAELNPPGMRRLIERLEHLDPEVRDEFMVLTSHVAEKAAVRQARLSRLQGPHSQSSAETARGQRR